MSDYLRKIDESKGIDNLVNLIDYSPNRFSPRLKYKRQRGIKAKLNKLTCDIETSPYYTAITSPSQLSEITISAIGQNLTFIGSGSANVNNITKSISGINQNFSAALSPSLLKPSVTATGLQGEFSFDPSIYGTVRYHYDPNDLMGVAGDPVALLSDKSVNALHLTQLASTKKPLIYIEGLNKWLEFDGVDDNLGRTHESLLEPPVFTLFMALNLNNPINFAQPLSKMNGSNWTQGYGLSWYTSGNTLRLMLDSANSNNARIAASPTGTYLLAVRYNPPNMDIWLNDTLGISDSFAGPYTSTPFNALRLGSGNNDNYFWSGRIGETVMWSEGLTNTEISDVFVEMNNKWNIY